MDQVPRPDEVAFHQPLRLAVTALVLLGASLAAIASILSLTHHALPHALAFVAVTMCLAVDAVLVWRHNRWAVLVTLVGLAGQATAVAGTIAELALGIADVKARQLRQLGFKPEAGVTINLIYSTIGFALFGWFAVRWLAARRHGR
jgi:hypothetical protein